MLKSFRKSCFTTTMAMAPFLLSACGGDDGQQKSEMMVILPLLFFTVSLIFDWGKKRSLATSRSAA